MGRNSTGELVQEIPQESKTTELQVPPQAQVPATADRPALSLGFRSAGDIGRGITGSTHSTTGCPSEQTCWRSPPFSRLTSFRHQAIYLTTLRVRIYFNINNFEDGCYFNDGNAEDCYFTDGQGANEAGGALKVNVFESQELNPRLQTYLLTYR